MKFYIDNQYKIVRFRICITSIEHCMGIHAHFFETVNKVDIPVCFIDWIYIILTCTYL
jgi:hypothetical protein